MEAASSTRVSRAQMNTIFRALCSDFLRESAEVLQEELSWKKEWTRKWILRRKSSGASSQLLSELRVEDPREYRSLLRMSPATFDELLHRLTPIITKQDTVMREALSPKIKLEVTLAFLATGASYRILQGMFRVSKPSISKLLPEVCEALYNVFGGILLQ
ncbi:hypothetical protein GE061_008078 [Apolygus lucorum]|uniref:DDE Tnp4 domain-containing protein n=1 Tax=Apolygus lucorum TaxID=248454 RepID=A0A6A4J3V6_APOLU|nr:hypothetical protein GE061_008078 [Apolygus lucorum]